MALTAPAITSILESSRAAGPTPFLGVTFSQLTLALGASLNAWAVGQAQNVALTGSTFGAAGAGAIFPVTTRIIIPPDPAPFVAGFAANGIVGPTSASLAVVLAVGLSSAFASLGQYSGVSSGVATGLDASKILFANPVTLNAILGPTLVSFVGPGPVSPQLALGLSIGICQWMLTGTGVGTVTPAPGAPPPVPPAVVGITSSVLV